MKARQFLLLCIVGFAAVTFTFQLFAPSDTLSNFYKHQLLASDNLNCSERKKNIHSDKTMPLLELERYQKADFFESRATVAKLCQTWLTNSKSNFGLEIPELTYRSQFRQDWFVLNAVMRFLYPDSWSQPTTNRNYVELGCAWPTGISNSYFFDSCLMWHGLCIDGDRIKGKTFHQTRAGHHLQKCVGDVDGYEVTYGSTNDTGMNGVNGQGSQTKMRCLTLKTILEMYGMTHVNYFSLDVEGYELKVLKGIDFDAVSFDVISVEMDKARGISEFLMTKGYERLAATLPHALESFFVTKETRARLFDAWKKAKFPETCLKQNCAIDFNGYDLKN